MKKGDIVGIKLNEQESINAICVYAKTEEQFFVEHNVLLDDKGFFLISSHSMDNIQKDNPFYFSKIDRFPISNLNFNRFMEDCKNEDVNNTSSYRYQNNWRTCETYENIDFKKVTLEGYNRNELEGLASEFDKAVIRYSYLNNVLNDLHNQIDALQKQRYSMEKECHNCSNDFLHSAEKVLSMGRAGKIKADNLVKEIKSTVMEILNEDDNKLRQAHMVLHWRDIDKEYTELPYQAGKVTFKEDKNHLTTAIVFSYSGNISGSPKHEEDMKVNERNDFIIFPYSVISENNVEKIAFDPKDKWHYQRNQSTRYNVEFKVTFPLEKPIYIDSNGMVKMDDMDGLLADLSKQIKEGYKVKEELNKDFISNMLGKYKKEQEENEQEQDEDEYER